MFVKTWPPQAILVSDWLISKTSSPLKPLSQMSGFRGEDFFFKSTNQKQELHVVAIFFNGSAQNVQSLERTFHR
jgi:hypothetical protein